MGKVHRHTSILLCLSLGFSLLWQTAAAVELGELRVESLPGQTLDVHIPLSSAEDLSAIRLLPHGAALYQKVNIEYSDLHERIVTELVMTAANPHIAVSSIGAVNAERFNLVVGLVTAEGELVKRYAVVLTPPAPPPPDVLTAAEVLSQILNRIADATGLTRIEVLGSLRRLITDDAGLETKYIVFRLGGTQPDESFVNGFQALLSADAKAEFAKDTKTHGALRAMGRVLFADRERALLKKLLAGDLTSDVYVDGGSDDQMGAIKNRMAAMENQITALKHQLLEEAAQKDTEQQPQGIASLLDRAREYARGEGWDKRALLSRQFWFGLAAFWLVLLALMVVRQYRHRRLTRQQERQRKTALPGQGELEKEIGYVAPAEKLSDGESEINNQLNLATTYIEMGDHIEAQEIIDAVIKRGTPSQVKRAHALKDKVRGDPG